jgi:hypothetical protein
LHGRFMLFNPADLRHARPQMEKSCKLVKPFRRTCRVYLDIAVRFVANPSNQCQLSGFVENELAKADTLHVSSYKPTSRLLRRTPCQWIDSVPGPFRFISSDCLTVSRN